MNQAIVEKQKELAKILQDKAIRSFEQEVESLKWMGERLAGKDAAFPVDIFNPEIQENIKAIIRGEAPSLAGTASATIAEKLIQEAAEHTNIF